MSVGIGQKGNEVTLTVGSSSLLGTNTKGITFNNSPLDTTNDTSSGFQVRLAKSGVKSIEVPISGLLENLELINTWFGTSQVMEMVYTFLDGSTITCDMFLDSISTSAGSDELFTFEASLSSSGTPVFVAGT